MDNLLTVTAKPEIIAWDELKYDHSVDIEDGVDIQFAVVVEDPDAEGVLLCHDQPMLKADAIRVVERMEATRTADGIVIDMTHWS